MRDELGKLGIQEKDANLLNLAEYTAIVLVCPGLRVQLVSISAEAVL
jgi:hypothetical protein